MKYWIEYASYRCEVTFLNSDLKKEVWLKDLRVCTSLNNQMKVFYE